MQTTVSGRVSATIPEMKHAQRMAVRVRMSHLWRAFIRRTFPVQVVGNPLHEAWSADGEPLERMRPEQLAKTNPTRYLIVPHSRGR